MKFLIRHSLLMMFVCALLGFAFPQASQVVFPFLPIVLFSLMAMTLLGIEQKGLLLRLRHRSVWHYGLVHSVVNILLVGSIGWCFSFDRDLLLAAVSVAATGSLFATPAIVRALGFDSIEAMAMTIVTTLLLPMAIVLVLALFGTGQVVLDWESYFWRLVIFILGPMLFSFLVHHFAPQGVLQSFLFKVSPYTILLVFAFPFGLIGSFRILFDEQPWLAVNYLLIAMALCMLFFTLGYLIYRKQGREVALTSAITSGNRNVLLTYSIAGAALGPAFLPLAGALQLPTYILPVLTRWLNRRLEKKQHS